MKTIGVLTSGGDAPGMNACIAAIADRAEKYGARVRGIFRGFVGLLEANHLPIGAEIDGLARRGGSFLGTSRNGDIKRGIQERGYERLFEACGIEGLIVLGGGGSLEAASKLSDLGAPIVGVPCTIDNDVPGTDYCIGFDSAVNRGLRAVDEILDTAESLSDRVFMVETMGGNSGHIALDIAFSTGADAVFIHEQPAPVDATAARIKAKMDAGGTHGLVIICEDMDTNTVATQLQQRVGRNVRLTVLGHVQRGGAPSFLDRKIARLFGAAAVDMMLAGETGRMIAFNCEKVTSIALRDIVGLSREIDLDKYRLINGET